MTAAGALILKMVIAAFSGMGAATVCHPLDVIRVQMQTEGNTYKGFGDAAVGIYQKDGVKDGLFAGVSAGEWFCICHVFCSVMGLDDETLYYLWISSLSEFILWIKLFTDFLPRDPIKYC